MKPSILRLAALTIIAASSVGALALQPPAGQMPAAQHAVSDAGTFSVTFGGGPLEAYVVAVRKAAGDIPVNVSVADEVKMIQVPAVSLERVTPFLALQVLRQSNGATKEGVDVSPISDSSGGTLYLVRATPKAGPFPSPPGARGGDQGEGGLSRMVLSLTPLLMGTPESKQDETLGTILSAVEASLKLGRDANDAMPDVALHKESRLLMVLADKADQDTIREVFAQMLQSRTSPGGQWTTRTYDLLSIDATDAARAILTVFPETNSRMGQQQRISIKSPKQIEVAGPVDRVLQIEGIVNYADRPHQDSQELVQLRTRLDIQGSALEQQMRSARDRETEAQARLEKANSQIADLKGLIVTLQAQLETRERRIQELEAARKPESPKP